MSKSVAGATGSKTLSGGRCSEKDIVREGQDYGALDAGPVTNTFSFCLVAVC